MAEQDELGKAVPPSRRGITGGERDPSGLERRQRELEEQDRELRAGDRALQAREHELVERQRELREQEWRRLARWEDFLLEREQRLLAHREDEWHAAQLAGHGHPADRPIRRSRPAHHVAAPHARHAAPAFPPSCSPVNHASTPPAPAAAPLVATIPAAATTAAATTPYRTIQPQGNLIARRI
jgi:hypothetical protein